VVLPSITDFEYTVACAAFDMLDIVLVHGWLLDEQDDATVRRCLGGGRRLRTGC